MMKPVRGVRIAVWLLLAGHCSLLGCGQTHHVESHSLQAVDETGNLAYYRVRIETKAALAKTHYRAGLYDARAVDAVLGEVSTGGQKDSTSASEGASRPDTSQNDDDTKFIIVFSSNASVIEELIADFVEQEETTNALIQGMAAIAGPKRIEADLDADAALKKLKALQQAREALSRLQRPDPSATPDVKRKFADDVRRILTQISSYSIP